jgi:hypothetical protein
LALASGLALAIRPARPVEAPGSRPAAGASHAVGCEAPLRLKGPARVVDRPGIAQVGTASTDGEPPPPLIYGSRCLPPDDRDGPEATVVRLGQCYRIEGDVTFAQG